MAPVATNDENPAARSKQHNPPVELPVSNASNFFEEAKVGEREENELRRKFHRFCIKEEDAEYLDFDSFCRLLQHYESVNATLFEAFFHAMDRDQDDKLSFSEFFHGAVAADPLTVHILNSYTGCERSRFVYDFYDTDRNQLLDFEEFRYLNSDCQQVPADREGAHQETIDKSRELGVYDEDGTFIGITQEKFYQFIQHERLRGTSRLFRFQKSLVKEKNSKTKSKQPNPVDSVQEKNWAVISFNDIEDLPSDYENLAWHAHLLDIDSANPADSDTNEFDSDQAGQVKEPTSAPAYTDFLPPAPDSNFRTEVENACSDPEDALQVAKRVLHTYGGSSGLANLIPARKGFSNDNDTVPAFTAASPAQLRNLCSTVVAYLAAEDMVLTGIQAPVKVFGALHGQLLDLQTHFKWHGPPTIDGDLSYTSYVFLGDYVDRGTQSLEVLLVILCMKVIAPKRVFLLRGHHENRHVNHHLGLLLECKRRLGVAEGGRTYEYFNWLFDHMSLAAVVSNQLLAFGPGLLPSSLIRLDQLRRYPKPLSIPHPHVAQNSGLLNDQLLMEMFNPIQLFNSGGGNYGEMTAEQVDAFCLQNRLASVIVGRRLPSKGYAFDFGGRLVSITSCVNYCDLPGGNDGSILCVTKEEEPSTNLVLMPKVATAKTSSLYSFLGQAKAAGFAHPGPPSALRWPTQVRSATPDRPHPADDKACGGVSLVITQDRRLDIRVCHLPLFPAYGPGRPPNGFTPTGRQNRGDGRVGNDDSSQVNEHSSVARLAHDDAPHARGSLTTPGATRNRHQDPDAETSRKHSRSLSGTGPSGGGNSASTLAAPGSAGSVSQRRERGVVSPSADISRVSSFGLGGGGPGSRDHRGAATRRVSSGGKPREHQMPSLSLSQQRGPSRPPGSAGPGTASRQSSSSVHEGAHGSRGPRRGRNSTGEIAGSSVPSSPRQPNKNVPRHATEELTGYRDLLVGSPTLIAASLPSSPSQFLQASRAPDFPLISFVCRLWIDAGLSDRDWSEALRAYDQQLGEQPSSFKLLGPPGTSGGLATETREGRWTLETFSMWVMKTGRKLQDCQTWFDAFDLDNDGMISVIDFLQGVVATSALRTTAEASSARGLCNALVLHRLLKVHEKPLDGPLLRRLVSQADVHVGGNDSSALHELAQRASTDFDCFRATLLPLLNSPAFSVELSR